MPITPLRVLLVDPHALFRDGLSSLLNATPDIEVVGEAGDALSALAAARRLEPELILLDTALPGGDGIETARCLKSALPRTMVVMLTAEEGQERMVEALLTGADGYLLKSMRAAELIQFVRALFHGEPQWPSLVQQSLEAYRRLGHAVVPGARLASLTIREREIIHLVGQGATNREIATTLNVSINTVKTHMRHILEKLHAERRREVGDYSRYLERMNSGPRDERPL